jgi:hypothetical protein
MSSPRPAYYLQTDGYHIHRVTFTEGPSFILNEYFPGTVLLPTLITMHQAQGEGDKGYVQVEWSDGTIVNYYNFDSVEWTRGGS